MPTFAYLIPFVLFFGSGRRRRRSRRSIYAMPAAIRITALGIRGVPATTVEAAGSLGATRWQIAAQGPAAARPPDDRPRRSTRRSCWPSRWSSSPSSSTRPGLGVNIIRAVQTLERRRGLRRRPRDRHPGRSSSTGSPSTASRADRPARAGDRRSRQAPAAARRSRRSAVAPGGDRRPSRRPTAIGATFPDAIAVLVPRTRSTRSSDWIKTNLFLPDRRAQGRVHATAILNPLETVLTSVAVVARDRRRRRRSRLLVSGLARPRSSAASACS